MLGFAIVGVYLLKRNKGVVVISLLIISFAGSLLFFKIFYRYRVPVVPLVTLLAGAGIVKISQLYPRFRMLPYLLFICLFFILTYTNPNKLRTHSERISVAKVLIQNKRYKKAENYIHKLDQDSVQTDTLYRIFITSLLEDGKTKYAKHVILTRNKERSKAECKQK